MIQPFLKGVYMNVILFDLGKTIVDNYAFNFRNGLNKVLEHSNCNCDITSFFDKLIIRYNKRSEDEIKIKDVFIEMEKELNFKFNKSYDELEIIFFQNAEFDHLIDGVKDAVIALYNKGYYMGVVSNSTFTGNALKTKLDEFGISKYFKFIYSSADCGKRKPHIEIFNKAKELVIKNCEIIDNLYYIGNDYEIDVLGSMKANFKPIWLNMENRTIENNQAFLEISSYSALIAFINKFVNKFKIFHKIT